MNIEQLRSLATNHRKAIIIGTVAIGIGAATTATMHSYLQAQTQEIEARYNGKTVSIVVARGDLQAGTLLSSENLAARRFPVEFAQSSAISADNYERLLGRTLSRNLKKGDAIMSAMFEGERLPTFSARVGKGRRAITVPVDDINSISGMLEPEDKIDLIATQEKEGRRITFTLQQQIRVLATGQRTVSDPKTGEKRQFSTVTLDATPAEAQRIIAVREQGKLTALLRNPEDTVELTASPPSGAARQNETLHMRGRRESIPILYGGGSNIQKSGEIAAALHQPNPLVPNL